VTLGNKQHCMHPTFLATQIESVLQETGLEYVDTVMLHNPEVLVKKHFNSSQNNISTLRRELFRRIFCAFEFLEQQVSNGKIRGYGISSNGFSLASSETNHVPFQPLMDLAAEAAKSVGNTSHSFIALQMPINILEREAISSGGAAEWAKQVGLKVIANRPLNAFDASGKVHRLASYPHTEDFNRSLQKILADPIVVRVGVDESVRELAHRGNALTSVLDIDGLLGDVFASRVAHAMLASKKDESISEDDRNHVSMMLHAFSRTFDLHFKRQFEHQTRDLLLSQITAGIIPETSGSSSASGPPSKVLKEKPLQDIALSFLMRNSLVDCILVGMRQPDYVVSCLDVDVANKLLK